VTDEPREERGPDGLVRCPWSLSAPEYVAYHDTEWGWPVDGVSGLYERLTLEAFQSGLAWITILRKRENFRRAFAGFDPVLVAGFGEQDRARLLADAGIVRNVAKVDAALSNARVVADLGEGFVDLVWSFRTGSPRPAPGEHRAVTPESTALAKALRAAGIRFVGPTTGYALMQACGLVDDHRSDCEVPEATVLRAAVEAVAAHRASTRGRTR
jgi:DNA-3-methyladenine glycosylase I